MWSRGDFGWRGVRIRGRAHTVLRGGERYHEAKSVGDWRKRMDVLVSGGTGFIGEALIPELEARGHRVKRLTRMPRSGEDIRWDPDAGTIEGDLAGTDAVIHLAGESSA